MMKNEIMKLVSDNAGYGVLQVFILNKVGRIGTFCSHGSPTAVHFVKYSGPSLKQSGLERVCISFENYRKW